MLCKLFEEFDSRNVTIVVIGSDSVSNYRKWQRDIEELQEVKVGFPICADQDCSVLRQVSYPVFCTVRL